MVNSIKFRKCHFRSCPNRACCTGVIRTSRTGGDYTLGPFDLCAGHMKQEPEDILGDGGLRFWASVVEDVHARVCLEVTDDTGHFIGSKATWLNLD